MKRKGKPDLDITPSRESIEVEYSGGTTTSGQGTITSVGGAQGYQAQTDQIVDPCPSNTEIYFTFDPNGQKLTAKDIGRKGNFTFTCDGTAIRNAVLNSLVKNG